MHIIESQLRNWPVEARQLCFADGLSDISAAAGLFIKRLLRTNPRRMKTTWLANE